MVSAAILYSEQVQCTLLLSQQKVMMMGGYIELLDKHYRLLYKIDI